MKKHILAAAIAATLSPAIAAQTAIDAFRLSEQQLRGTARFMSMGGAFTALGGDLTTLGHNPGGIGIYRNSEIGATLDIDFQRVNSTADGLSELRKQTKAACNNFGYIGATPLNSNIMPYMQWGVSYGRVQSFNRRYSATLPTLNGSLTNYVASYTAAEGWTPGELNGYASDYNPFQDSYAPWMSVMMYNAYGINPSNDQSTDYQGLYNGTPGMATADVVETGYVDEYNINLGGNIMNMVYWGLGIGITDLDYTNTTYYTEDFDSATIPSPSGNGRTTGSASLGYESWKHMYGTGFNFKIGVIVKPINELRVGLAVHTPTYYNMTYEGWAQSRFNYSSGIEGYFPNSSTYGTADDWFTWKYRTPWRLMVGVAGVIGQKGILSAEYEYRPYDDMKVLDNKGVSYDDVAGDIKTYYRNQSILRLGAEYRLTQNLSLRAGYSYMSSPVTTEAYDDLQQVYTSGPDDTETQPSYTFDSSTGYVTCGLGYHYKWFYLDAAYVWRHRTQRWHAYTPYDGNPSPTAELTDNQSNLVLSIGFKF